MDVKTTFLNGGLSEEVYMMLPVDVNGHTNLVKLNRSLCALKKANRFNEIMKLIGFEQVKGDP